MSKYTIILISIIFSFVFSSVRAVESGLDESAELNVKAKSVQTMQLFVPKDLKSIKPNALELSINVINGKILNFEPNPASQFSVKVGTGCNGVNLFSVTKICAAFVKNTEFVPNELLGYITFSVGEEGETQIVTDNSNKLVLGGERIDYKVNLTYKIISTDDTVSLNNEESLNSNVENAFTKSDNTLSFLFFGFGGVLVLVSAVSLIVKRVI